MKTENEKARNDPYRAHVANLVSWVKKTTEGLQAI